jgi:hypothetical protein
MTQTAFNRYELTWDRFVKELGTNPKITLHTVCKTMHTDYGSMKKWANRISHSVIKEKAVRHNNKIDDTHSSAFAVLVPKDNPPAYHESFLVGISITFNSGTTINIKQADADSIIRLVSIYERKDGGPCTP